MKTPDTGISSYNFQKVEEEAQGVSLSRQMKKVYDRGSCKWTTITERFLLYIIGT